MFHPSHTYLDFGVVSDGAVERDEIWQRVLGSQDDGRDVGQREVGERLEICAVFDDP